jgi:hypothetical protein
MKHQACIFFMYFVMTLEQFESGAEEIRMDDHLNLTT